MEFRVAMCQTDPVWGEKETNLKYATDFVGKADADLVVFPEMFTTGFDVRDSSLAEDMHGRTVEWFRQISSSSGKAVAGSLLIKEEGEIYNRFIFARPDAALQWYDKRHLFSFSGEGDYISAGSERIIIEFKGFRILPLVCYDLRFPVWSRGSNEFDLMIYVASWDSSRIGVWDTLLKARAIENQCYVVGVNRTGTDPNGNYNGHSLAVDYYGKALSSVPNDCQGMATAVLDLEALERYRSKFRAWQDSDKFMIL